MAWTRQQQLAKKKGDALHKRLKSKLFSLEFGENAGASSSMMESKTKVLEKMLDELHRGNFNPSVRSGLVTPDSDAGTQLEMSCIPFEESPFNRRRLGTNASDSVFFDTPELTRAGKLFWFFIFFFTCTTKKKKKKILGLIHAYKTYEP